MKSRTLFCLLALCILGAWTTCADSPYEQWMKKTAKSLPAPAEKGDSVFTWWPIDRKPTYTYKVVDTRWEFNRNAKGVTFTLRIQPDTVDPSLFHMEVTGFDGFPYLGLRVRDNRVCVLLKPSRDAIGKTEQPDERPLAVFPLVDGLRFYDLKTEFDFLKQSVLQSTDTSLYGPLNNGMFYVTKSPKDNEFSVRQNIHAPLTYQFRPGVGISRWDTHEGYTLELVAQSFETPPVSRTADKR